MEVGETWKQGIKERVRKRDGKGSIGKGRKGDTRVEEGIEREKKIKRKNM